jgi:eukaryotic-like serine/threonine-protein kinase
LHIEQQICYFQRPTFYWFAYPHGGVWTMLTETKTRDELFARHANQSGMATSEQIEQAQREQEELLKSGSTLALSHILIKNGVITEGQRDNLEKKIQAQQAGGIQSLGAYRLLKKLGEGGMGAVYLAEDTVGLRKVAVKVLPKKFAEDNAFLSRFRREAKSMGALNHANVVGAFAVGEELGHHFYVMEYCEGDPLDKLLQKEKTLPVERALEITAQAARGIRHAHEHGIIHRDIKPANMFVTKEGVVKILDLGLSKNIADAEQSYMTQSGVVLGTPHYISPEQALGQKEIDGRSDIYSLGATLFHLLTGQTPFNGPNIPVILTKHLTEQLPNPQDIQPGIPDRVVLLLQHMMAKLPENRYQTCDELIEDLERVLAGQPPARKALDATLSSIAPSAVGKAVLKTKGGRKTSSHDPVGASASRAEGGERPVKPAGAPVVLYAGGALVALIGLVALILFMRGGDRPIAKADSETKPGIETKAPAGQSDAVQKPVIPPAAVPFAPRESTNNDAPRNDPPRRRTFMRGNESARAPERDASNPDPDTAKSRLAEMLAYARQKRVPPIQMRNKLTQFVEEFKNTAPADEALKMIAQLDASQGKPAVAADAPPDNKDAVAYNPPEEQSKPAATVNPPVPEAAKVTQEDNTEAQAAFDQVLKDVSLALKARKYSSAVALLEEKLKDPALASMTDPLAREKADVETMIALRQTAYDNLKQKKGEVMKLGKFSGVITVDEKGVGMKSEGMTMPLPVTQLEPADVDELVPVARGADGIETLRGLGLMYLAAGDVDSARKVFADAKNRGGTEQIKPYMERLDLHLMGETEGKIKTYFDRAEKAFNSSRWNEAKSNYAILLRDFKNNAKVTSSSELIKDRMEKIERELNPQTWVNLARKVDPDKDTCSGDWNLVAGEIQGHCGQDGRACLILPYRPPEEYDFKVVCTRKEGEGPLFLLPCKREESFAFAPSIYEGGRGLSLGGDVEPKNVFWRKMDAPLIETGKRVEVEVQVRKDGVKGFVNGKEVAAWKTDFKNTMSHNWEFRKDKSRLAVASNHASFQFHSIEVKDVTGRGKEGR